MNGNKNNGTVTAMLATAVSTEMALQDAVQHLRRVAPRAGQVLAGSRETRPEVVLPEPVLLLHGGANHSGHWRPVIEGYQPLRQLVAMDLHASGRTGLLDRAPEFSLDHEAELVEAEVRRLGGRAHVVGHSYGGAVALRVAERAQVSVLSLALIEPVVPQLLKHMGEIETHDAIVRGTRSFQELLRLNRAETGMAYFVDAFNGAGTWQALDEVKRARLTAMAPGVALGTQALLDNPARPEALARIAVPTTVLYGERTGTPERRMAELAASVVPGSRLETLPGAAHMSPLTHPELVRAAIAQHLRWAAGQATSRHEALSGAAAVRGS